MSYLSVERLLSRPNLLIERVSDRKKNGVVFEKNGLTQHPSAFGELDSHLINCIEFVDQAIPHLAHPEVSGTTKRELLDRTLRAVGKKVIAGETSYQAYSAIEYSARNFYGAYHATGDNGSIAIDQNALQEIGRTRIVKENRNLAAGFWEKEMQEVISKEVDVFNQIISDLNPVVVSIAFGGNEPALLLSNKLNNCPIVHLRINEEEDSHSYFGPDDIDLSESFVFLVDDVIKSGETLKYGKQAVSRDFNPKGFKPVIIHNYKDPLLSEFDA